MLGLYIIFDSSFFNIQNSLGTVTWLKYVSIICFLSPPVIKLSIFYTLVGDLNTLNSLNLTMDLLSKSWTIFYGFFINITLRIQDTVVNDFAFVQRTIVEMRLPYPSSMKADFSG